MPNPENLKPFKKGHKNATGRPKGSRNKSTIFKEALALKDKNGITNEQKLLAMAIKVGLEGDLKAIFSLFDGAHGKDKQVVEQTNMQEKPVQIQFIKKNK